MKLKKIGFIVLFISLFAFLFQVTTANAQLGRDLKVKLGFFNPKDAKSGFIIGGCYGMAVDEAVDIGFGADFYKKTYSKGNVTGTHTTSAGNVETYVLEQEFSSFVIPIMANVSIKFPMAAYTPLYAYISGAIGWELMWNTQKYYGEGVEEEDDTNFFNGFGWMAGIGVMYQVGSRSALLLELGYNASTVKSNIGETTKGYKIWDQMDISGMMIRGGISMTLR